MRVLPPALTLLSAVLYSWSFPPVAAYPLAWVALVPFLVAVSRVTPRRAAGLGVLWCLAAGYGVGNFVPAMVADFFDVPRIFGWAVLLAILVLPGIFYAGFGAWISWLSGRRAVNPLIVAAGWGVCEFLRTNAPLPNPWTLIGYSQISFAQVVQLADLGGPYAVGMVVVAVNAAIAGLASSNLGAKRPLAAAAVVAVALAAVLAYGQWRLSQTFGEERSVRVAVIQGAVERKYRFDPSQRDANLGRYLDLTWEAAHRDPQLIFWPEFAIDFYLREESEHRDLVLDAAWASGADLLLGGPHYRLEDSKLRHHNSIFLIRDGRFAGRYDKVRLLPFGEDEGFGWLSLREKPFSPGRELRPLHSAAAEVGVLVCSEAMAPDLARRLAARGADVLANPANDYWFGTPAGARHQLQIAAFRAIENRRYLVRATPTGYSAIIDPHGRTQAVSGFGREEILEGTIRPSSTQTPYQRAGDTASWLALVLVLAWTRWTSQRIENPSEVNHE